MIYLDFKLKQTMSKGLGFSYQLKDGAKLFKIK